MLRFSNNSGYFISSTSSLPSLIFTSLSSFLESFQAHKLFLVFTKFFFGTVDLLSHDIFLRQQFFAIGGSAMEVVVKAVFLVS
tara:strand:+ start:22979 stop:23227 length:249 start_codon:yes stop_codon:yes gene_type:complete